MRPSPIPHALAAIAILLGAPVLQAQTETYSYAPPQPDVETYAQRLTYAVAANHPELNILSLHLVPPGRSECLIAASSNNYKIGKKSDPGDIAVMKTGKPVLETNDKKHVVDVGLPLMDDAGNVIGTTAMEVKQDFTKDERAALKRATEVRDELKRQIQSKEQLFTKATPPQEITEIYAQRLMDQLMTNHPELAQTDIHATPPGTDIDFNIACSNRSKVGRRSGHDNLAVLHTGQPLREPDLELQANDVGLQLMDAKGNLIGITVMKVKFTFTRDTAVALAHVTQLRDEMTKEIPSQRELFAETTPPPAVETRAQRLVSKVAALHPELNILSLHVKTPGGENLIIASSNFHKIGEKSDPDDLEVMKTGKPVVEANDKKHVIDVGLPLLDARANVIGTTVMEIQTEFTKDTAFALKRAMDIRDELKKGIPLAEQLFAETAPPPPAVIYAQRLLNRTIARHPEIDAMSIHATPPGAADAVVIADSGRAMVGTKSAPADLEVMKPGAKPAVEAVKRREFVSVGLPLVDSSGRAVGSVVMQVRFAFTQDPDAALKQATAIRDELKRQITSSGELFAKGGHS